jgi:hypothetical protein
VQVTETLEDAFQQWQKYEGIEYDTPAALVSELPAKAVLLQLACASVL